MNTSTHPEAPEPAVPLAPIDLLLGEGSATEQIGLRAAIGSDPTAMFAMAETVALVERFRELRTDPSPAFGPKLADVVARAERRLLPPPSPWPGVLWGLAAAAVLFAVLRLWHPLARSTPDVAFDVPVPAAPAAEPEPEAEAAPGVPVLDARLLAWRENVDTMRRRLDLEPSPHLREAFEAGLDTPTDALGSWLDPRNALMLMRLDHERRGDAGHRRDELARLGGMAAADERIQQLADVIALQLPELLRARAGVAPGPDAEAVALGVRAVIAAGPAGAQREHALDAGGDWLAQRIVAAHGAELVWCLTGLVETSVITGAHRELASAHGERLLRTVLEVDAENWSRRLPDLLGTRVAPAVLAEASRVLGRLPLLGADGARCALVRQLLLGPLRERRAHGEDSPRLVAAMLYGSADLLPEAERAALELQLRRWQPVRLVPDYTTVQQYAWSLAPGRLGFTRHHAGLRQLAVLPDPGELGRRAALCMSLATGYAGGPGAGRGGRS